MKVNAATASESARHQSAIEALARETRTEPAHVRQLYDKALARLEADAKVRGYLVVLAGRNVRAALREARKANPR
jgi:hypothetical protein